MGFEFVPDDRGRSRIVVVDEPDFIVPLPIAPSGLEELLIDGKWLVVSMSVWSIHDIRAGHHAIELVKTYGGKVKLGLRPFDYPQENLTWVPNLEADFLNERVEVSVTEENGVREVAIRGRTNASPIWVGISNGEVKAVLHGQLTDSAIEELIAQLLRYFD